MAIRRHHCGCAVTVAEAHMSEKPSTTLPGTVEKIIKSVDPHDGEKAQIVIEGADHLYKEIRIDNALTDQNGEEVRLKPGAEVEVTVEAPPDATIPKEQSGKH
jgi:predicted DNA-binding antitoxin AbrB/MazE fold protein